MTEDRLTRLHTFDIYVLGCGNSSQRTNNPSHVAGFFTYNDCVGTGLASLSSALTTGLPTPINYR